MLAILMYHQVINTFTPSCLEQFYQHLIYLKKHYPIVAPGQKLATNQLNLCLTFDDAYCDFYYYVYPKLTELSIPATVAVPAKYILANTTLSLEQRLAIKHGKEMQDSYWQQATLCTWQELSEMHASGLVNIASHSYSHVSLTQPGVDLMLELQHAKKIIENKTNASVNTFVYPFGDWSHAVHQHAIDNYDYVMRIGSALNKNWHNRQNICYRLNADPLWINKQPSKINLAKPMLKYIVNIVRGK